MNFLHTEIGSAKDNASSPIHNWYKFTAGFSYKFVNEIIVLENLSQRKVAQIFDPFAGCGTTLVSAQKLGVDAVGNEAQSFMFDIIRAKLNWNIDRTSVAGYLKKIEKQIIIQQTSKSKLTPHPLLASLYSKDNLQDIYFLKAAIGGIKSWKYRLFFKLALSQTLHKTSIHPIAVPYITRNKILSHSNNAVKIFLDIVYQMLEDTNEFHNLRKSSKIFKHDSRVPNKQITNSSCDVCITSPPYLNNLDYGEVSKVHTHFFGTTTDWNDITVRVRKNLVTGSTTHYKENTFALDQYQTGVFAQQNPKVIDYLLDKAIEIKAVAETRSGRKSFDVLMFLYFQDMFSVLREIRRVIKPNGKAYLILGDSAPYGIHIATTETLGQMGVNAGFKKYEIHKIRARGNKWKKLKYRHSLELTENLLVLQ